MIISALKPASTSPRSTPDMWEMLSKALGPSQDFFLHSGLPKHFLFVSFIGAEIVGCFVMIVIKYPYRSDLI